MSGPNLLKDASWFDANWPFLSAVFVPIGLVALSIGCKGMSWGQALRNAIVVGWLAPIFYCWHQTEEHAYDMRGWRYAFVPSFNHKTGALLFPECEKVGYESCPLDPRITTYVNVVVVWIGFPLTMLVAQFYPEYEYAGLFNWGMSVVNAVGGHLLPWLLAGYNPGAAQSIFMAAFGLYAITREGFTLAVLCLLNGVILHVVCFGVGMNLILKAQVPEEVEMLLCLICSSAVPLFMARLATKSGSWYSRAKLPKD